MAQRDILRVLSTQKIINKESYLTSKEIRNALKNLGCIVREENINKCIRKIAKTNVVEVKDKDKRIRSYRLKEEYTGIFLL